MGKLSGKPVTPFLSKELKGKAVHDRSDSILTIFTDKMSFHEASLSLYLISPSFDGSVLALRISSQLKIRQFGS